VATNISAGFTDLFRTLATFLAVCLFCLLLPIVPRWQELLLRVVVVAGLVGASVGGYEIVTQLGVGIHGRWAMDRRAMDRRAMEQITALMSSVNLYAGILALILPWCVGGVVILRGAWRGLAAVEAAAVLVMIVLLQSRAAWLAVLAGSAAAVAVLLVQSTGQRGDDGFGDGPAFDPLDVERGLMREGVKIQQLHRHRRAELLGGLKQAHQQGGADEIVHEALRQAEPLEQLVRRHLVVRLERCFAAGEVDGRVQQAGQGGQGGARRGGT
jgi:hypothetical protein